MPRVRVVVAVAFIVAVLLAGCAAPPQVTGASDVPMWRGRLAVRVEANALPSQKQSFSAAFELTGTPLAGELTLFTPLGTTAAALTWSPQTAVMRSNGDIRTFESLDALIKQALGTDIPVAALFAWLAGDNAQVAGWRADLTQHAVGRITARRTEPMPAAELRLVLEK
jgi:outer membrane lipoprotein LolB